MIARTTFYNRLTICQACEFWQGRCAKGHVLQGALGCPLKKFAGVDGVGYCVDKPVPPSAAPAPCCEDASGIKPMTAGEAVRHLTQAIKSWKDAGCPLTPSESYQRRISTCRSCSQYQWFQCKQCRCVVYAKAKLATESCPLGFWS